MNSWKIILAALVIFGAGVMAGTLVATHHPLAAPENPNPPSENRDHPPHMELPRPPLVEQSLNKKFLQQLNDKLQLSADQYTNIQKIISEGQEKNHAIWTNVAPEIRGVIMDTHKQIREQLTSDQKEKFEELLKQLHPPRKQNSTNAPPKIAPMTNSAATASKPCA